MASKPAMCVLQRTCPQTFDGPDVAASNSNTPQNPHSSTMAAAWWPVGRRPCKYPKRRPGHLRQGVSFHVTRVGAGICPIWGGRCKSLCNPLTVRHNVGSTLARKQELGNVLHFTSRSRLVCPSHGSLGMCHGWALGKEHILTNECDSTCKRCIQARMHSRRHTCT